MRVVGEGEMHDAKDKKRRLKKNCFMFQVAKDEEWPELDFLENLFKRSFFRLLKGVWRQDPNRIIFHRQRIQGHWRGSSQLAILNRILGKWPQVWLNQYKLFATWLRGACSFKFQVSSFTKQNRSLVKGILSFGRQSRHNRKYLFNGQRRQKRQEF